MSVLVRKIESQKWKQNDIFNGEDVSADAITGSLRTTENTLSVWKINSDDEIEDAILAIVSLFEKADTIDIVKIDPTELEKHSLTYNQTTGITAYEAFKDRHFDIQKLSYSALGAVALIIVKCLKEKNEQRITRKSIKAMILSAIESGKIKKENLKQKLVDDIGLSK